MAGWKDPPLNEVEKAVRAKRVMARTASTKTVNEVGQYQRLRVTAVGAVQGVGFRPFVYRLANELKLSGWIQNSSQGICVEVEGEKGGLDSFLLRLEKERPSRSSIQSIEFSFLDPLGFRGFTIRPSDPAGEKTALVLPDIAVCADCVRELFDPENRRYFYPFINCTNCGPRFTIIERLPYDRPNTSMKDFTLCDACRAEYENPSDRRFHAQPIACPQCGPHLELWDRHGAKLSSFHDALRAAAQAIREGAIVAMKGLGGFHLIASARVEETVGKLRRRKHREEKPLALMYPSMEAIKQHCEVSEMEERLLCAPESPIVLLSRLHKGKRTGTEAGLADSVAPGNPALGIMLAYTPLHHLLMRELEFPVVATSGNLSDEPVCIDEKEALSRLRGIADSYLVHNRPIVRHADDSVVRVIMGRELVLRRARGYAPLPVRIEGMKNKDAVLAAGAHLKNTVALAVGENAFVSQHIGDLDTAQAREVFHGVINSFERLYEIRPASIACDIHPDYLSTRYATRSGAPLVRVQHHYAHVLGCMAENELRPPVLGVAWDGTGYGTDGTIWGGEFLQISDESFHRAAHLRTFPLPGGDTAIKEPRRSAIGLLYEIFGEQIFEMENLAPVRAFTLRERIVLRTMLRQNVNVSRTSSAGRLFDAVAAIADLRQRIRFEGQAAMELEFALDGADTSESYELRISDCGLRIENQTLASGVSALRTQDAGPILDWEPLVNGILEDIQRKVAIGLISAKFHNALAEAIVSVAKFQKSDRVVLTGGCFQNKYLTERAVERLRQEGFRPYWHQRIPPNDGGISLGQLVAARRAGRKE